MNIEKMLTAEMPDSMVGKVVTSFDTQVSDPDVNVASYGLTKQLNDNLLGLTSQMSALKNWHISQAYTGNNNQIALSKSKDEYSFIGAMISTDTGTSDNGEVLQGIIIIPTSIFTSYTFKTLRVGAHDNSSVQMKYVDDTHIKMDVDSGKKGRYILID